MKGRLCAFLAAALTFGAVCLPVNARSVPNSGVVIEEYSAAANSTIPVPSSTMSSGNYIVRDGFKIKLSGADSADEIRYSINGTGFRRYTEPLTITQSCSVKAYIVRNGRQGPVETYTYNLIPLISISHYSGTYDGVQRVFINCDTPGTKLYYTLDGSVPSERSAEYSSTSGILVGTTSTLKVIAVKPGWYRSVRTYNYTINGGQDVSKDPFADGGLVILDTTTKNESLLNDFDSKWGYNQLRLLQKVAYEKIFVAVKNNTARIDVSRLGLKAADFEKIYWAFDYDNPQFLALGSGYSYYYYPSTGYLTSVTINYGRTYSEISAIQNTFNNTVKSVTDAAKNELTDYAKLKYIHDWIVNNTEYTLNGPAYKSEADGPVVYGKALCEGYSKTFMYMAQELGFDCICVVGKANNTAHMWNMVKLGGAWYHVDVTFDDPITSDGSNMLTHDYFLVGTYEIGKTHTIDNPISVPSAPRSY